ncbi:TonB-dependent receptor family protein [Mariniflexile sp.]|uniref:TonB-dependent receptor family protein n=1 Tax=Mariniflexile sp. TaxID=1979402 RepID=UPI004048841B
MHYSKIILVFLTLFGFSFSSFSQSLIEGKIIDGDNKSPLSKVQIINTETKDTIFSNSQGVFRVNKVGIYSFKKEGYNKKTINLKSNKYYVIQLSINPSELNEVIINANNIPQKLKKAITSSEIISTVDIERGNSVDIAPILNRTPGIFMQSGALNTNRITIRGIGSRNLYGTSKIRAYFQDIPLTSGNGETTIEDFELGSISRFEIIKGSGSSIYGAGLGGTIHLMPQSAYLNQNSAESDILFGSFGLIKGIVNVNHGTEKNSFRAIYSNTHSDGYRDNNDYNRQTFTINTNHFLNDKNDITFLGSYVDLKGFIPSSINENTYKNNPKEAAFTWAQSKGYEDTKRGVFGLSWNHQYNSNIKQTTSVFTSFKDAYEPRPFDVLTENTSAIGIRSRILGSIKKLNWTFGGELFKDNYKSRKFKNLYKEYPAGTGSVEGDKFFDLKEKRTYYNIFFETNYHISEKTMLSFGLNFNKTSYTLNDRFVTNDNPDQSGSYEFKGIVSPKLGISYLFTDNISLYSNISHGFSPPSTTETLLPDGLINPDIKPETGWNFEIGTRSSFFNNRLQLNLALYRLDVRNLLVARRTGNDEFIGVNAGKTQHDGLEFAVNFQWLKKQTFTISTFTNYTLNNFVFKEFIDDTNNYSGNDLTGVPKNIFNAGIDFQSAFGVFGNINFQHVGSMPINDSNSLFSDSYNLSNLKFGFQRNINKKLNFKVYLGINNIFDEAYASQILINASGFGGTAPRYYYPGNPVNYYSGLQLSYSF